MVATLDGLHAFEYEHPFDSQALETLKKTPGLDAAVRQYSKQAVERIMRIQFTGSNIQVTEQNHPKLLALLQSVCLTLNSTPCPELFIQSSGELDATALGTERPMVVLCSGAVENLDEAGLRFLLGHAVGHIKSHHTLFQQLADLLPTIADVVGHATFGIGKLVSSPLQLALMRWSRMAIFTADRAGLLACQDWPATAQVMLRWAGSPGKNAYANEDTDEMAAFLQQAGSFDELDYDGLNKTIKWLAMLDSSHPWTVMRAAEMLRWVDGGEYERVLRRETVDRVLKRQEGSLFFCRECNHRLQGDEKFCPTCGGALLSPAQR